METFNDSSNRDFGERSCLYRVLNTPDGAEAFFEQHPIPEESTEAEIEKIIGRPACPRPSCLLNLRIMLSYVVDRRDADSHADMHYAVPPECQWRQDTGIQSVQNL